MNKKIYLTLLFSLVLNTLSFGQSTEKEYYFTVNTNLYLPINTPDKGTYPILWYDKETNPKVLIGGFGIGMARLKPINNKLNFKEQVNLSKQNYWHEPIQLIDETGNALQLFQGASGDISLGATATVQYALSKRLAVGTGLGGQILLISFSRNPELYNSKPGVGRNRYYKPFVPTLPIELVLKSKNKLFSVRYEQGLINRLKNDLATSIKDKFGLLFFEVGFKL